MVLGARLTALALFASAVVFCAHVSQGLRLIFHCPDDHKGAFAMAGAEGLDLRDLLLRSEPRLNPAKLAKAPFGSSEGRA